MALLKLPNIHSWDEVEKGRYYNLYMLSLHAHQQLDLRLLLKENLLFNHKEN